MMMSRACYGTSHWLCLLTGLVILTLKLLNEPASAQYFWSNSTSDWLEVQDTGTGSLNYWNSTGSGAGNIKAKVLAQTGPEETLESFPPDYDVIPEDSPHLRRRRADLDTPIFLYVHPLESRPGILQEVSISNNPIAQNNADRSIQIKSYARSQRDGPVNGWYFLTTHESITLSVDPEYDGKLGHWLMYGGSNSHKCLADRSFGNGWKAIFQCASAGTYFAFYRPGVDLTDPMCQPTPQGALAGTGCDATSLETNPTVQATCGGYCFKTTDTVTEYLDFITVTNFHPDLTDWEYRMKLDKTSFSDPVQIFEGNNCYRWAFRLHQMNTVGFVFDDPGSSTDGTYRQYELTVWVLDPMYMDPKELTGGSDYMTPNVYSQVITRRFYELGVSPCIRWAHKSIEIITEPIYEVTDEGDITLETEKRLKGPHWKFQLKVYFDRVVSTLSDIQLTITPRQHSALYGCFIADVRVVIPGRSFQFLKTEREDLSHIHLPYTSMDFVRKKFVQENALAYFGETTRYVGPSWNIAHDQWDIRTDAVVFVNPCVSLEFALAYKGVLVVATDGLMEKELQEITLPSFYENDMVVQRSGLYLSDEQERKQKAKLQKTAAEKPPMRIADMVFTPSNLILLTAASSIYLQPSNLALKGIGYNTKTQKYRLGALVRRKWCANTATPKSHNMWVPAFSRNAGSLIIIYSIPVEGTLIISRPEVYTSCEPITDTTTERGKTSVGVLADEAEIHADEAADRIIDAVTKDKLRSNTQRKKRELEAARKPPEKPKFNEEEARVFWKAGSTVLEGQDKHFAKGISDPANVKIGTNNSEFNKHVLFVLDSDFTRIRANFELNGLTFGMDESVFLNPDCLGEICTKIMRDAPNYKMFNYHAIEFSAVEKRYMVSTSFQSNEFTHKFRDGKMHTMHVIVTTLQCDDLPVVVSHTMTSEIELDEIVIQFSGSILRREDIEREAKKLNPHLDWRPSAYAATDEDFLVKFRLVQPPPLSRYTATMSTINTAIPVYIIRLHNILIYASLDGSLAKPILSYEFSPTTVDHSKKSAFFPAKFIHFDVVVTEQGLISVLSRKYDEESITPVYVPNVAPPPVKIVENEAFIGSVLSNEPLRYVHPFLPSQNAFQAVTPEGEISYGVIDANFSINTIKGQTEATKPVDIPFWSLFKGSVAYSAGANQVKLDIPFHPTVPQETGGHADAHCPFASFEVDYVVYPYVEALYKTRLTTEVAYYGDNIPLEADIIVEFSEVQGISISIASYLEVDYDQTVIRKVIDVESLMTRPVLEAIQLKHLKQEDDGQVREKVRVFTLTIRASIINLHCEKKDYFRTIQLNIGCFPFTKMKLIGEALPLLRKVIVDHANETKHDYRTKWYQNRTTNEIYAPRDAINARQREEFKCAKSDTKYCTIPVPPAFTGGRIRKQDDSMFDFFDISFRDVLVPKFEQFLTKHARRVTGNIIMYDLLQSEKPENKARSEVNTTQWNAKCLVNDSNWFQTLSRNTFSKKPLPYYTDIYRHYKDCFSTHAAITEEDKGREKRLQTPQDLALKMFYVYNRTNFNALKLPRKRNYVYIFRAVVVNTDHNRFTFCEKLDTFFGLQVVNVPKQREALPWYFYLGIVSFIVIFVICNYFYFARVYTWRTELITNRQALDEIEVEDPLQAQLAENEISRQDPFKRLAHKVQVLSHWKKLLRKRRGPDEPGKQTAGGSSGSHRSVLASGGPRPVKTLDRLSKRAGGK